MIVTRTSLQVAINRLNANGWRHVLTCMTSDQNAKDYGLLFAKGTRGAEDSQEFWLNQDTIAHLPQ